MTSRRNWTPNNRPIPPARITSKSSMKSAPPAIPAMIELSFPAGFTSADLTLDVLNATFAKISSEGRAQPVLQEPSTTTTPILPATRALSRLPHRTINHYIHGSKLSLRLNLWLSNQALTSSRSGPARDRS